MGEFLFNLGIGKGFLTMNQNSETWGEHKNSVTTLENGLAVSLKVNHMTPKFHLYLPNKKHISIQKLAIECSWQHEHNIIANSPKVETTQKFINWETDRQNVVYPDNGVLFNNKKLWSTDNLRNIIGQRNQTKSSHTARFHIYETSIIGKSCRKQISDCLGLGVGIEVTPTEHKGSFWSDGNVPKLDCGDSCTTLYIY